MLGRRQGGLRGRSLLRSSVPAAQNAPFTDDPFTRAFPDLNVPDNQDWLPVPGDFITPSPTPPPLPAYTPTTIITQERVIDLREPGSDWDYRPAWGALADFPLDEDAVDADLVVASPRG
ncbi:hypothetical protein OG21DRAFT_1490880 [Imleria badia]|nr:hypothetical protein OG21DRAFT_1490880 [Imleria badia]